MRKLSWNDLGIGAWSGWTVISLARQDRQSRLEEEVDEFTFGYFESGTFTSPRFLFLVFRNLKTKWLGLGIESDIFPHILPGCSYGQENLVTGFLHEDGTLHHSQLVLFCDWRFYEITKKVSINSIKVPGTFSISVLTVNTTIFSRIHTTNLFLPYQ